MINQARDGNNHNREFGGDEFDVYVYFLMDADYGEEAPSEDVQENDEGNSTAGDGVNKSRITVRYSSVKHTGNDRGSPHSLISRKQHLRKCRVHISSLSVLLQ